MKFVLINVLVFKQGEAVRKHTKPFNKSKTLKDKEEKTKSIKKAKKLSTK